MESKAGLAETALIAGLIVLVGDVVCSQGQAAALIELSAAGVMGLLAATRYLRGQRGGAAVNGAQALVFAAFLVAALGFDVLNNRVARSRAEKIVDACAAYKAKTGGYPQTLRALVPDCIKEVPRAKFTVLWSAFHYGEGKMAWTVVPLAVMPSYDFGAGKWGFGLKDALPAVLGQPL